jgi:hypothetical protein
MFEFIANLSESLLFSSKTAVESYKEKELAEIAYLSIITLRILLWSDEFKDVAKSYCKRTTHGSDFESWRTDATDLYAAMYGLVNDSDRYELCSKKVWLWLHKASQGHLSHNKSDELFVKLDYYFHINNESMRAVRRLAMEFYKLNRTEQKLCITRLIQLLRHRALKSELFKELKEYASTHNYEIKDANDPENKPNILKGFHENASAGATSAASIASVAGGLGAGFDNDYSKSVYGKQKPIVIRRNP